MLEGRVNVGPVDVPVEVPVEVVAVVGTRETVEGVEGPPPPKLDDAIGGRLCLLCRCCCT